YEFDIIAENGNEIVVVEVKTTLRPRDIKEFLDELKIFKQILPKYKDNIVYGALAYLQEDSNCSTLAEKKGLFTIRAKGKSAWISNQEDFKPKAW
ncbi:MAG: hypothetical protein NT007_11810, partial [Candidatus Kapabacteria bacterium]|nr:hypothetical protein [Candidatus Kapabacteria bacterium]